MRTLRYAFTILFIAAPALAQVTDSTGRRVESVQPWTPQSFDRVDLRGNRIGSVRELSPGNWHILDNKGMTIGKIQTPPGCTPFGPCPTK